MSEQIMVQIMGHPRPQPRPRFVNGRVISTADANAKVWRAAVMNAANRLHGMSSIPLKGPLQFSMAFVFPTPKEDRHGKPHTQVPDVDNLAKLILDAMQDAGVLENDSAVSSMELSKSWGPKGGVVIYMGPDEELSGDLPELPGWLGGGPDTDKG
jgi:Holliday junction resolvase RusA-like endonuclease